MLRISWLDRIITNEEVMSRINKEKLVIHRIIDGKKGLRRRRTSRLKNMKQWISQTTNSVFIAAINKIIITNIIAKVW